MFYELQKTGLFAKKEYSLPLVYGDVKLSIGYRVDLMVERKVIVEIKSVGQLTDVHAAQVLTYLKLSKCKIGLLLNFNVADKKRNQALYIVTVQICDSSVKSAVTIFASQTSNSGL